MANNNRAARVSSLRDWVVDHRKEILRTWQERIRALPAAQGLSTGVLVDHVPELLDEIGQLADEITTEHAPSNPPAARQHALVRMAEGFDVKAAVEELSILRDCVATEWERDGVPPTGVRAIDRAIDQTLAATVALHAAASERTLAKLESLLAASPVGIAFVDRDLRYVRINEALAALNGRPAAEHIGKTVREVLPEHAEQLEALLRSVLDTGEPVLNIEVTTDDEPPRHVLGNYFPVRTHWGAISGVGAVVLDVTETKATEQALRLEQARLQSIVEHAPAAIWVKDAGGRIVLANRRVTESVGLPYSDVIGKRSDEILPAEVAAENQRHDRMVVELNRAIEVEEHAPSPEGTRTFLSIKFPIPGGLVGGIATEITDRKRMEEDLRVAVRTREDMMAVVGHDMRSPLGAVQLSATLLHGQLDGDSRARRHLDMIQRACARIENLIDDLLDTASIRAGRFQIETRSERLHAIVDEAIELQKPFADERGITLVSAADLAGLRASCDRDRVLQVFGNLIGNALKFGRAGDTITVGATRDHDAVRFSVADTGPGIELDLLDHLFDPYWSAPEHAKAGSGLGLYIVRGIVESHGGRVWVESQPGAGATFYFTLPLEPA